MVCQTVSSKTRLFLETVSMKTWGQTPWDIDFDLTGYQQPRLPEVDLIDSGVVNNHLLCPHCNEVYEVLGSHLFSAHILCMCNAIRGSRCSRFSSGSTFYYAFITFVSSYVKKSPQSWRIFQSDQPTSQPNIVSTIAGCARLVSVTMSSFPPRPAHPYFPPRFLVLHATLWQNEVNYVPEQRLAMTTWHLKQRKR